MYEKDNFCLDLDFENKIAKFLDEYFYPRLDKDVIDDRRRNHYNSATEKKEQNEGNDIFLIKKGKEYIADEKGASHYIVTGEKKGLPTFAFELSYKKNGEIKEGWLTDKKKKTDVYVLCWIWIAEKKYEECKNKYGDNPKDWLEKINWTDIEKLEVYMIPRKEIHKYLKSEGFTIEQLKKIAKEIRNNKFPEERCKKYSYSGQNKKKKYKFKYTKHLPEKPINIIIYKSQLLKIAYKNHGNCYTVTKEGIEKIEKQKKQEAK